MALYRLAAIFLWVECPRLTLASGVLQAVETAFVAAAPPRPGQASIGEEHSFHGDRLRDARSSGRNEMFPKTGLDVIPPEITS
jgi:hypothetical protein